MGSRQAIGIDLGTAYSCVAVFQNGRVTIISDEQDKRTTPSYVTFTNDGRLVGDEAKYKAAVYPNNAIFNVKRLIGRKYDDPIVQNNLKHWLFQLGDDMGKPKIIVEYKNQIKLFTPEEISALILRKMKQMAEAHLGENVTDAVITVPATFNDSQRQATKDAGTIAGLNVLRIISEPVAAAMAYGFDKQISNARKILIFDLGGGTTNVSVVTIEEGIFEVNSTSGDVLMGGEDFDKRMVTHFIQEIRRKHNRDLSQNKRAIQKLRTACEQVKLTLSSANSAPIIVDSLDENFNFDSKISRARFEELNTDLFRSTLEIVEKALRDAKMDKSHIDEIVLIGGSSRIPKIRELLQNFFNGKQLNQSINPDEAVAYGAAIQAGILMGNKFERTKDLLLLNATPFSLGIETAGGKISRLIKRNTTFPTRETQTFTISPHYQSGKIVVELIEFNNKNSMEQKEAMQSFENKEFNVDIKVFEGEHELAQRNYLLGYFTLSNISLSSGIIPQIEITFDLDANGILDVSAVDKSSQKESKITVINDKGRLSKLDMEYIIKNFEKYDQENDQ